jgi:DinB superfamily
MNRRKLETLLLTLESTPALLARAAAERTACQLQWKPEADAFSLIENVWHLADLEREAYGVRIGRLLAEDEPTFSDFDGDRIARERRYNDRDLAAGLTAFSEARFRNIETLRHVSRSDWKRWANQEGVGRITLEDLPRQMARHDAAHTQEIANLLASLLEGSPCEKNPSSAVA